MGVFKKAVRFVGIEPENSSQKEKKDGGVDHRAQRGNCRNPAQKAGDKAGAAKRRRTRSS